ncbi:MAG: aldose 1-epimerase [Armatimonadetes bacterium]|nr:aldose 1-epimerase [Armatimonadota bacterium]MDE2206848.1 aldose 1-epimerase [Armatimonadota bacterium]
MTRYHIETGETAGFTTYTLFDEVFTAAAALVPELGGNCVSLTTSARGPGGTPACEPLLCVLPPADLRELMESPFHAGIPVLFPFPNRVRDGAYVWNGRALKMQRSLDKGWDRSAHQAIHGLAGDQAWKAVRSECTAESAALTLEFDTGLHADVLEQYPFRCSVQVCWRLSDGELGMEIAIANKEAEAIPIGFGIHPWFPTQLRPGVMTIDQAQAVPAASRANLEVTVPCAAVWQLQDLMPTGRVLALADAADATDLRAFTPLDGRTFDTVYTRVSARDAGGASTARIRDLESGLELYVAAAEPFREWVVYAPTQRNVICLEPYTCVTDAINLQPRGIDAGLIALEAGSEWRSSIRIGLSAVE